FQAQGEGPAWRGVPAEWPRIEEQLQVAAELSRNPVLAFSAPDYMTPLGGESAAALFQQIMRAQRAGTRTPTSERKVR
ncbi:MAG: hypothetical protein Q8L77_05150, partial [Nitrospirota bacterium]|nr:hypothetical protein [Nitrospirota bacterium]